LPPNDIGDMRRLSGADLYERFLAKLDEIDFSHQNPVWRYFDLIGDLLDSGALVRCLPTTLALKPAFYVVTADDMAQRPEVETFTSWIVSETAVMR
jgi:hypothetical protein